MLVRPRPQKFELEDRRDLPPPDPPGFAERRSGPSIAHLEMPSCLT